jgi:hypothetical protein
LAFQNWKKGLEGSGQSSETERGSWDPTNVGKNFYRSFLTKRKVMQPGQH